MKEVYLDQERFDNILLKIKILIKSCPNDDLQPFT